MVCFIDIRKLLKVRVISETFQVGSAVAPAWSCSMPFRASTCNASVTNAWSSANLVNRMLVNLPTSQTAGRHSENNDKNSDRVKARLRYNMCTITATFTAGGPRESQRK